MARNVTPRVLLAYLLGFALLSLPLEPARAETPDSGPRILWVDSYNQGYEWSDGVQRGIIEALAGTGVRLEIVHMDTKRHSDEADKVQAGLRALEVLERFDPDLVIASDDNAQKYFVVPHLLDRNIPVVFCGVNWDARVYGYPTHNITGMLEVEPTREMIAHLRHSARGDRIGYLSGDTDTDHKNAAFLNQRFYNGELIIFTASTFEEFKTMFHRAQAETDMLYLYNAGIQGWDHDRAVEFLASETRVPTGSHLRHMAPYVVYTMGNIPEEQGDWAAKAALRILDGVKPDDIPMAFNERIHLIVNLKMAKAASIVIPVSVLKVADVIGLGEGP